MVVSATTIETEGGEECPEQGCSDQCRCDNGSDDDSGGDGGEHFSDGGAENRNCRNAMRSLTSRHKCLGLVQK